MKNVKQNVRNPVILFFLTVFSVFIVGLMMWENLRLAQPSINPIYVGITYVIGLMGIIGIHEFGHIVASRYHGIQASWPYFIPMPLGLGTFGAFITQKTPTRTRNSLFDVGIAGPIFGFVAAIIFSVIGLLNSTIVPKAALPPEFVESLSESSLVGGQIFIFEFLIDLLVPNQDVGSVLFLHPFAYAGFWGLFLTGINLMPMGQADGGHVARSLFSENSHRIITYISAVIIILVNTQLIIFVFLLIFMYSQSGHAGPLDDVTEISTFRKIIAVATLLLIPLCFPISIFTI
jgi:membrane-associated protease RseP (regulator of RpoE activity)